MLNNDENRLGGFVMWLRVLRQTLVVTTHGCGWWVMLNNDEKRLGGFVMWLRVLRETQHVSAY